MTQRSAKLAQSPVPCDLPAWLNTHFDVTRLSQRSQAQLEDHFIGPPCSPNSAGPLTRLYGVSSAEFAHLRRSFTGMATKRPEYLPLLP